MAEHIKVYEEKKKGLPIWAWLLPLLLLLALAGFLLSRHKHAASTALPASSNPVATPGFPDLGTVHFETDQATLTPEDQATLQRAASAMKANPNVHLRLEGYTDSTGADPHNLTLSQRRAQAVPSTSKGRALMAIA